MVVGIHMGEARMRQVRKGRRVWHRKAIILCFPGVVCQSCHPAVVFPRFARLGEAADGAEPACCKRQEVSLGGRQRVAD